MHLRFNLELLLEVKLTTLAQNTWQTTKCLFVVTFINKMCHLRICIRKTNIFIWWSSILPKVWLRWIFKHDKYLDHRLFYSITDDMYAHTHMHAHTHTYACIHARTHTHMLIHAQYTPDQLLYLEHKSD